MIRPLPTLAQIPPTGLDRGARMLLVEAAETLPSVVVHYFFAGSWADLADYLAGLDQAGHAAAAAGISLGTGSKSPTDNEGAARTVLTYMPDGDFLTAIERALHGLFDSWDFEPYVRAINEVSERRGVPYRIDQSGVFEWVGDPLTETEVLAPALSALDDPRLSGGPHDEFIAARAAIREGTPQSYRRAVAEACNAVESGLKVLLTEHGVALPNQQHVDALLAACRDAGIFPPAVSQPGVPAEQIITGPARFGNRRGRHGAGPVPHDVEPDEAEAVVASAAVALTLIARRLPAA